MKKRLFGLALITILSTLTSCSFISSLSSRTELLDAIDKSDREIAEGILLEILDALENKDSEALKSMLSEEAVNEAEDLDEDIQYVLDYYQGTHIEYKGEPITSGGKYRKGRRTEYHISTRFEVKTEIDRYIISFGGRTIYDDHPEQVGLDCIQIIKTSVNQKLIGDYGIYVVTEKRRRQENAE